jgi:hypothetical protein
MPTIHLRNNTIVLYKRPESPKWQAELRYPEEGACVPWRGVAVGNRLAVAAVKTFTVFLGRSPDQATIEDRVSAPKGTETLSEPCQAKSTGFLCEK